MDSSDAPAPQPHPPDSPDIAATAATARDTDDNDYDHTHTSSYNAYRKDESDTCRICRGEGSADEPLFYPCKCSGSIKYVHQDCLMEWLSHSQKKYCELCKTPFHFTKLYSPTMPSRLPTGVFVRRAVLHVLAYLGTWLRGALVGSVWLVCVPWVMRCMWRIMFWIGDAGWARDGTYIWPLLAAAADDKLIVAVEDVNGTAYSSAVNATFQLPALLNITSPTLNMSQDPLVFKLARGIFTTMAAPLRRSDPLALKANITIDPLIARMLEQSHSSILSEVHVLKTLSASPFINRFVMDVLEGQIITLSVVVVCILVFLIREWVVQQQPVVDLAAADAANALAQAGGGAQNRQDQPRDDDEGDVVAPADPVDQVDGANPSATETESEPETNVAAAIASKYETSLYGLRDSFSILESARTMLAHLDDQIDGGIESLPKEMLSEIHKLQAKMRALERRILADLKEERVNMVQLVGAAVGEDAEMKDLLSELFGRVEKTVRNGRPIEDENTEADTQGDELNDDLDNEEGEEDEGEEGEEQSERRRGPKMPDRRHTSLATDIARMMQEFADDKPQAWPSYERAKSRLKELREQQQRDDDDEGGSNGSGSNGSGSWQQVSATMLSRGQSRTRTEASPSPIQSSGLADAADEGDAAETKAEEAETRDGTGDARDDLSWVSTAGSTDERTMNDDELPENPFAPEDTEERPPAPPLPPPAEGPTRETTPPPAVDADEVPAVPVGLLGRLAEWLWGDIHMGPVQNDEPEFVGADDERVVQDLAQEAPFIPFEGAEPILQAGDRDNEEAAAPPNQGNDGPPPADEAIAAAAAARGADVGMLDADALEDAEDLEGILELIGMQGPLGGLLQNAVFSSILISLSIALCVFVPYVWGKLVLLHIAEPSLLYKVPLKTATVVADLAIDAGVMVGGFVVYAAFEGYRWIMSCLAVDVKERSSYAFLSGMHGHAKGALERLVGGIVATNEIEAGDFLYLSMACHAALYAVEEWTVTETRFLLGAIKAILSSVLSADVLLLCQQLKDISLSTADITLAALQTIWAIARSFYTTGTIHLPTGTPLYVPEDPMLTFWNARDRFLAILAGYAAVGLICGLYVKFAPLTSSRQGKHIESHIVEACMQAGGVLKVILIISIEMIAFPLFCGFLLDFALMPLFENATFSSRVAFTIGSPWTSGFVHWFVGTCYMFHFALFVSMCRRILRKGVLYFIRDPDDPTFHPVRDVLERNVITQLRKIAFSAIVYGALIIVCLGGIVWGLWVALDGVLPIHWSSTGSNIEFPLDILFYNFLTPFVVHYAKPSAGITAMYDWWFRQAARALRLSDFLFREQKFDEEGHWVRHTWKAWIMRRVNDDLTEEDVDRLAIAQGTADEEDLDDGIVKFVPDGRYVRAPASDQVRIPKGTPVFVPVTVANERLDGNPDDEGVHAVSSTLVTKVYIPPWFKVRISLFILAVWFFAAATGISVTIVPLLFGRYLLSSTFGPKEFINDIYAFSLGIYLLGGALYAGIHRHTILNWLGNTFIPADGGRHIISTAWKAVKRIASLIYVYSTLAIGLPLINAVLLEVYILMPMHYFFDANENHVMHLVQDWTLGILYVRIGMRIFLFDPASRPARAIRQVFAKGYLHPDAGRATRYFILPALLGFAALMGAPFASAVFVNKTYMRGAEKEDRIAVMRMAYPLASAIVIAMLAARTVIRATVRWRARIRDELYLVGERLHNFGERKAKKGKEKASSPSSSPSPSPSPSPQQEVDTVML